MSAAGVGAGSGAGAASTGSTSSTEAGACCPVCLEALDACRPTVTLTCRHAFHLDCIGNAFNAEHSNSTRCPMCRAEQPLEWRSFSSRELPEAEPEGEALPAELLDRGEGGGAGPRWDEHCTACRGGGELLCCETAGCSNAMHLGCAGLSSVPSGAWRCPWCALERCGIVPARRRRRVARRAAASDGLDERAAPVFVVERRSARQERQARRRTLGAEAAVRALRRRRVRRQHLGESSEDESTAEAERNPRWRRRRRGRRGSHAGSDGASDEGSDALAASRVALESDPAWIALSTEEQEAMKAMFRVSTEPEPPIPEDTVGEERLFVRGP